MPYNMPTSINWTSGMEEAFIYLNSVTNNWFSNMLLISIYIIFAIGFHFAKDDIFGGFAVGGFVTFVISLILWVGGYISGVTFTFAVAVMIASFCALWIRQNQGL